MNYSQLQDALHYFRTYGVNNMVNYDTISFSKLSDKDMNETALINCIKDNLSRGLDYIDQHDMPEMQGYKKGIRHSMQVMEVFLKEYKAEKMARLKKVWGSSAGPLHPIQPIGCNNTTINLISRVSNIAGRVDLIRKIANEYEDHIDDVLDELDELLNYLFENINDQA